MLCSPDDQASVRTAGHSFSQAPCLLEPRLTWVEKYIGGALRFQVAVSGFG